MNLHSDISLVALRRLLNGADGKLTVHNIVVDYDGEVIVDPEFKYSGIGLNRYKHHTQVSHALRNSEKCLRILLENLVTGFDIGVHHILHHDANHRSAA